jgi:hypothetical protein
VPFTPFHFGPGLLIKSVAPRHLSLAAYAAANVVVDVEPLYHLLRGEPRLHGWTHTFIGAAGLGALAGLACAALSRTVVPRSVPQSDVLRGETSFFAIMSGAILGGITHPFFDGLMHGDLQPFLPFSGANPLLHRVPHDMVAPLCASAGLIGGAILWLRRAAWKVAA